MRNSKSKPSLKRIFLLLSVVLILVIFFELSTVLTASVSLFERYQQKTGQSMLQIFSQSLENRLNIIDTYINNLLSNQSEIQLMSFATDARTKFNARKSVSGMLSTFLQLEPLADGAMCWSGNDVVAVNSENDMVTNQVIKNHILSLSNDESVLIVNTGWHWVRIENDWFLVTIRSYQSGYVAVWMEERILTSLSFSENESNRYQFFCRQDEQTIGIAPNYQTAAQEPLTINSKEGDFQYCCLVLALENETFRLLIVIVVVCLVIAITVFLAIAVLRYYVNRTLKEVQTGLIAKGNDLNQALANTGKTLESDTVFKALDDMSDRIIKLQNSIYIHQINEQKARLQALHMQINSHFFGNCMNIIFSLAQLKKTSLIQEFSIYLIDYLQYINTAFQPCTALGDELQHLHNYIRLQQMRYPDRIIWEEDIQSEACSVQILPLMLLTFIENIFKHALIDEQTCTIRLTARCEEQNGMPGLYLKIEDDGSGISKEQASSLNAFDFSKNPDFNQKSGIEKTLARIQLFYAEKASFHIGPNEYAESGTVIALFLPHHHNFEA